MIVGSGDIAKILEDREGAIFFASGVSNSNEKREEEYQREKNLLLKQDKSKCIFYFSSISIDEVNKSQNRYLQHKKEMEELIDSSYENYSIIRIGNINWGTNPNTFINYIKNKLKLNEPVIIKDEYKFIIDQKTLLLLTKSLPLTGKNIINAFSKMGKVADLLK
jgi:hypothetical protein